MDSVECVDRASISCRHSDLLRLNRIVKDSHYHSHKTPKRQEPTFRQHKAQDERLTLGLQDMWWIDSCWSWNREHQQHRSNNWLSGHLIPLPDHGNAKEKFTFFPITDWESMEVQWLHTLCGVNDFSWLPGTTSTYAWQASFTNFVIFRWFFFEVNFSQM